MMTHSSCRKPSSRPFRVAAVFLASLASLSDGRVGPRRNFARLEGLRQTDNGPSSGADGLAVDALGRLHVASSLGIQVFAPPGAALGIIPLPKAPQNLAFAGSDKKTLYIVGRGAAYRVATLTAGDAGRAK